MTDQNTVLKQTILEELGLQDLPQEKQDELMTQIGEVIMKRIYLETMENLEKEDQEKLIDLMEKTPDGVEPFIREKIADYDNFVKKVVDEFKAELMADMGKTAPAAANAE